MMRIAGAAVICLVLFANMAHAQVPTIPPTLPGGVPPGGVPGTPAPPATPEVVAEPTSAAGNLSFTLLGETFYTLNWNKGNGANRLVIAKEGAVPDSIPVDNTTYTANAAFGNGTDLGGGQYVVYNGTGVSFKVTALQRSKRYFFAIYEYNATGVVTNYMTTALIGSSTTLAAKPSINATDLTFTSVDMTSFVVNFTPGNGAKRLVVAKKGSAVNQTPQDNTSYTANATFGSGTSLGAGNFVVYNGNGSSFTLNGLTANTNYYLTVFEFNGADSSANYLRDNAINGSQQTKFPKPTTGSTMINFSDITENSMTLSWIKGNGSSRMIVAKLGAAVNALPVDGQAYAADNNFFNGTDLGGGNYVVYNGTGNTCQVGNLLPNIVYHFSIVEYNGSGVTSSYFTTAELKGSQTSLAKEPTTASGSLTVKSVSETSLILKVQAGNGSERIIIAKQGGAINQFPVDGRGYFDNQTFEKGFDLGAGNYVVYRGSNTDITVDGLTPGLTYNFASFEYNGSTPSAYNYLSTNAATVSQQTVLAEPSTQADNIAFTAVTESTLALKWSRGNGNNCIVLVKEGAEVSKSPVDGTIYTASDVYGSGSDLGAANYVVYNGSGNTALIKGLTSNKVYHFAVFEYNGSSVTANYFITTINRNAKTTLTEEPIIPASNLSFMNIKGTEMSLLFTPGKGEQRIVVARKAAAVNQLPQDATGYTANAAFGNGSDIGAGNYVVYKGTGNSFTLTGLAEATSYYFAVFEFNGTTVESINYLTANPLTGMQASLELEPSAAASAIKFSNVTESSMTVSWKNGNGSNRLLIARAGQINKTPVDGVDYKGDVEFGKGSTLGAGNFVVYSGSGSSTIITGLTPNTQYFFTVFEYNGEKTTNNYYVASNPLNNATTLVAKPTKESTALGISPIKDRSVTVSWLSGNGKKRVVLARSGNPDFRLPVDGKTYVADPNFGAQPIETNSETYVVYNGTEASFELRNLDAIQVYYLAVIEYNESDSMVTSYKTDVFPVTSNLPVEPSTGVSNVSFSNVQPNSMTMKWTSGNGGYRLVVVKSAAPVSRGPVDGLNYTAAGNINSPNAQDLGAANVVVYSGIGDSLDISGLSPNTTYHFAIYEFNQEAGGPANYITKPTVASKNNRVDTAQTAINVIKNDGAFRIYPNPSEGRVRIDFVKEQGREAVLSVYNMIGANVFRETRANIASDKQQEIDLSFLEGGVYTILVQTDEGTRSERLVITK